MTTPKCPRCWAPLTDNVSKRYCKACKASHCFGHGPGSACGAAGCKGILG